MPSTAAGLLLRQSRLVLTRRAFTRNASTTSEAANAVSSAATKAKDSAANVASKASEGLSKVTSSATETVNSAASSASAAASSSAGQAQGRIGQLISGVQSLIPPTVYYGRVGLELGKLVVKGQGMGLPSAQHLQQYYQPIMNGLRNPTNAFAHSHGLLHPVEWLNRIRDMNSKDAAYAAIVFAEVIGFFTIGEIIGKMKVVGYKGEVAHRTLEGYDQADH